MFSLRFLAKLAFAINVEVEPLWRGFAINTVFYAALLWLMFAAPFALRRSIRRRRGLCPACAYPVGASDVCTECGKPVVKQKAETQKAETQKAQTT